MEYLSPSVYVENVSNSGATIESVSSSTGGFIGILPRGEANRAILVTSWTSFLNQFAFGLDTPFMANSDLVYSLYGFFQNGGTRAYIKRVLGEGAKKATASLLNGGETTTTFYAKDEGEWGNKLKMKVTTNADVNTTFDVKVYMGANLVESYVALSNDINDNQYFVDVINGSSNLISVVSGSLAITTSDTQFTGGLDNLQAITDNDYTDALKAFDLVDDVNLLCIPGQTSATVTSALASYVDGRGDIFAIFDAPKSSTVATVKTFRKTLNCNNGALYFPYIKVADPLSKTGKLRECPVAGHVMGVFARIINSRGVHKAPAGTEANIRGAIEVMTMLTKGERDTLNPLNINAITPIPNYGIVIWGARTLNPDSSFKYVSSVLLNMTIKKSIYNGTQWAVFEPNDSLLWKRVSTTIQGYLDGLWRSGALDGETPEQAYLVKCDEELNPEASRNQGKLITDVGYRDKETTEFVIFRVNHSMSN